MKSTKEHTLLPHISHSQHGVMLQRRRDGVKPDMPTAEEREQIITALGGKPY